LPIKQLQSAHHQFSFFKCKFPFQLQEQGKCNQEIVQTFPTPADGSSFGVGRGMMIFTSVPANHVKNSKFIKFIKKYNGTFSGEQS
jgi:hypothetical protein